jgi:hypothetical protein
VVIAGLIGVYIFRNLHLNFSGKEVNEIGMIFDHDIFYL